MLENIFSHASIVLESDSKSHNSLYKKLKQELSENNIYFLSFDTDAQAVDSNKKNLNFKIEDVQKIKDFQSSISNQKRFIITDRSIRSTVVQSALLKTLEEPTENTFIVIFTNELSILLPTVLSRCQVIDYDKNIQEKDNTKNSIINNRFSKDRFEKLERYLKIENLNQKGLVSQKQFEDYKELV